MKLKDLLKGGLDASVQSSLIWARLEQPQPQPVRRSRQAMLRSSIHEERETTRSIFEACKGRATRKKPHVSHGGGASTYVGEVRTGSNSCVVCHKMKQY